MFPWIGLMGAPSGTLLVIEVVDTDGDPVSTASVRFHEDGVRRRVNHRNGAWRGRTQVDAPASCFRSSQARSSR